MVIFHTDINYFVDEETKEILPSFARTVFKCNKIPDIEKNKFKKFFLQRYLNDNDFRKEHEGSKIIFGRGILLGIQYGEGILIFDDIPGTKILFVTVSENPSNDFMYTLF